MNRKDAVVDDMGTVFASKRGLQSTSMFNWMSQSCDHNINFAKPQFAFNSDIELVLQINSLQFEIRPNGITKEPIDTEDFE